MIVQPAIKGTIGILEAAKKEPGVKKVVITNSVVAIPPLAVLLGKQQTDQVFTSADRAHDVLQPYPAVGVAYIQSKIASLRAVEEWMRKNENDRSFDIITIHPGYVGGMSDVAKSTSELLSGTNSKFLAPVLGKAAAERAGSAAANPVDVEDVAKAHIESLRDDIVGDQAFLLTNKGGDVDWNDAKTITAKHYPEAVKSGRLPNDGVIPQYFFLRCDIEGTENTFGKLKSFEDTITGLVGQYLELLANEQK